MYVRFLVTLCLCAAFTANIHAQTLVRGHVVDAETGTSLVGVNITERKSSAGLITDKDGRFELEISGTSAELRFSHVGYLPETLLLDEDQLRALRSQPAAFTIRLYP